MKSQRNHSKKFMIKAALPAMMLAFACFLASCNKAEKVTDNPTGDPTEISTEEAIENWINSVTDEQGVYIGQDKEVVGYYKRIGIAKVGSTYEEMLELRDIEKQGYFVANDDGTAFFDLNGEKTEYVFDGGHFYLSDDTEKANGFRYTCINGRLIIDDGTTITQYLRLTDAELASYLEYPNLLD